MPSKISVSGVFAFLVRTESLESVEFRATCLVSKIAKEAEMRNNKEEVTVQFLSFYGH